MIDLSKIKQLTEEEITPKQEEKIKASVYPMIETVCEYLNNYFYAFNPENCYYHYDLPQRLSHLVKNVHAYGMYVFEENKISPVSNVFQKGDLIRVIGTRNRFSSYVTDVTGPVLTIDNKAVATTENALIMLVCLPECIEKTICEMIHYDVFVRETPDNLKSENIGSYSYTKNEVKVGGLYYPPEIISGIESFKRVRFV